MRYKERLAPVYAVARERKMSLLTAAEWMGHDPLVVQITQ